MSDLMGSIAKANADGESSVQLDLIQNVAVSISVEVGRSSLRIRDLLRLEQLMLNAEDIKAGRATAGHFPVSWCRTFQKGRVFYTSLGHREDMWDPEFTDKAGRRNSVENARIFQRHLVGGILWALGLAPGEATPRSR